LYVREDLAPARLSAPLLVLPAGALGGDLPGVVDEHDLPAAAARAAGLGLGGVKVFVVGHDHDEHASAATRPGNRMVEAVRAIKQAAPDLAVTTEVCGCSWTSSRECVLRTGDGRIDLSATYDLMGHMAVLHARAGADAVSPTAMLDGSIRAVRAALDEAEFRDVSVNPNVAVDGQLYEPFKELMGTQPAAGRRTGLQLDPARLQQASLACADRWLGEGADSLTLQPVMTNADAVAELAAHATAPIVAYSTSGEWAALEGLPGAVMLDYHRMLFRLGAAHVLSYAAWTIAETLEDA
jgi:porphobilinogen synthase